MIWERDKTRGDEVTSQKNNTCDARMQLQMRITHHTLPVRRRRVGADEVVRITYALRDICYLLGTTAAATGYHSPTSCCCE